MLNLFRLNEGSALVGKTLRTMCLNNNVFENLPSLDEKLTTTFQTFDITSHNEKLGKLENGRPLDVVYDRSQKLTLMTYLFLNIDHDEVRRCIGEHFKDAVNSLNADTATAFEYYLPDNAYATMINSVLNTTYHHNTIIDAYVMRLMLTVANVKKSDDIRYLWIYLFIHMMGVNAKQYQSIQSTKLATQLYAFDSVTYMSTIHNVYSNYLSVTRALSSEIDRHLNLEHNVDATLLCSYIAYIFWSTMYTKVVNRNGIYFLEPYTKLFTTVCRQSISHFCKHQYPDSTLPTIGKRRVAWNVRTLFETGVIPVEAVTRKLAKLYSSHTMLTHIKDGKEDKVK